MGKVISLIVGVVFIAICIYVYFLPAIVAHKRAHSKFTAIFVLNILMGWTFIGWVVAIVWAYTEDNQVQESSSSSGGVWAAEAARRAALPTTKKCPECAELVSIEARKCKHCGSSI